MLLKHKLTRWASQAINWFRLLGRNRHFANIRTSRRLLERLASAPDAVVIAYLRKVDPLVLEELVLTVLEERGVFVLGGQSYSGDGGIDGQFLWPGRGWHAIQVKRYSSAIRPEHVSAFASVVRRQFRGGVFVHTGRTGPMSELMIRDSGIHLLSGSTLAQSVKGVHPLRQLAAIQSRRAAASASTCQAPRREATSASAAASTSA